MSRSRNMRGRPASGGRRNFRRQTGVAAYYTVIVLVAMFGFCSFGVDLGRVQLVKTELRRAADAAGRAGAAGIPNGRAVAIAQAMQIAALNKADGSPVILNAAQDIIFGKWDTATKTFTPVSISDFSKANAVRVIARRTAARGDAVPTVFAKLIGRDSCDVNAEAIVMVIPAINVNETILATANPFLSGMPPGSVASRINPHRSPDYAGVDRNNPGESPFALRGIPVTEGTVFNFDSISGTARHDPNLPYFRPDGELADIGHNNVTTSHSNNYSNSYMNENGIADMRAPINALVAVFLDDNAPTNTSTPTPSNLDFSSAASRDFATLNPKLKQIFWIGDGKRSNGTHQEFIAPKGATRMFLATWDFYEWNNNAGFRIVKITRPEKIITVK